MSEKQSTPAASMQEVVDQLGITRAEAGAMIRAGTEMAALGARIYSAFLFGEVKERANAR